MQTSILDYLSKKYAQRDCDPKSNSENVKIWDDTQWCFSQNGPYKQFKPLPSEVHWKSWKSPPEKKFTETIVTVHNLRTLEMAQIFVEAGYHPLVLNMASNIKPGGGVRKGSRAQEEDLFRKTNYFLTLDVDCLPKNTYPLKNTTVIYSPQVTVIKDADYNYLDTPYQVDFIACPAVRNPTTCEQDYNGSLEEDYAHEADRYLMQQRIEMIYQVAYAKGHDSLILGALGCGAFHNPVDAVANIFKTMNNKYQGCFKWIGFAVFSGPDNPNYDTFKKILQENA